MVARDTIPCGFFSAHFYAVRVRPEDADADADVVIAASPAINCAKSPPRAKLGVRCMRSSTVVGLARM